MEGIVSQNNKGFIGLNGKLIARSSDDLKNFKALTMNGVLLMGATTFEKDLNKKLLPGRDTVVIGKNYHSMWEAIELAISLRDDRNDAFPMGWQDGEKPQESKIWVCGGGSIYRQLMPFITRFHISIIDDDQVGDVQFMLTKDYRGDVVYYNFKPNEKKEGAN